MLTMIVSSGSMIVSVSVCTSNVALDAAVQRDDGRDRDEVGGRTVAVPVIVQHDLHVAAGVAAAERERDLAALVHDRPTRDRDLGEIVPRT